MASERKNLDGLFPDADAIKQARIEKCQGIDRQKQNALKAMAVRVRSGDAKVIVLP